jgi:PIN domain nuclease of toxin-antitoxin system
MKLLLDTNIIIFAAKDTLPHKARALIEDEENRVFYSAASIWELVVKYDKGKLDLPIAPFALENALRLNGYEQLDIKPRHALGLSDLKNIHKDPFDRILVSQALSENMVLLTTDEVLARYSNSVICVSR